MREKLSWFKNEAKKKGNSNLASFPHPTTIVYRSFLSRLYTRDYSCQILALRLIERRYLDAWSNAYPGKSRFRSFINHWTSSSFKNYIKNLEVASNKAFAFTKNNTFPEKVFLNVAKLENDFWDIGICHHTSFI